jgi:hypothetical protein
MKGVTFLNKICENNNFPRQTYVSLSMALQPFVGPWSLFQFLIPIHSRYDSLGGGSARRKAATYTQDDTNAE